MQTVAKNPAQAKQNPFDEANSLLAFTIYHERPVNHSGRTSLKYYLKKKHDLEYDALSSDDDRLSLELRRSVRFIESKTQGRYGDNRIVSICVYFNDNKGGTIAETTPNPLLCKFMVLRNGRFELAPNEQIIATPEGKAFINDIMMGWQQAIERSRR